LPQRTVDLIEEIAVSNMTWGAERIRGELLKLGIRVSKRTIQKYASQARPPGNRARTWETFIRNHTDDIWACDFLQLYDVWFRPIFAFFVVKHGCREVVHVLPEAQVTSGDRYVTRSPSNDWAAQQLREATPWAEGPRFLIRDNDRKYGSEFQAVAEGVGIEVMPIPPKSPLPEARSAPPTATSRRSASDSSAAYGASASTTSSSLARTAYAGCSGSTSTSTSTWPGLTRGWDSRSRAPSACL